MENNVLVINKENIKDKIYTIRGQKVMLDSDLALIYGYTTKNFNRQVKNNKEKFDDDFMFQLTEGEIKNLRCKNFTSSSELSNYGGRRYLPYAFTEQGIYMLMTVLKGELATKQSKALIKIFKEMKDYIIETNQLVNYNNFFKLSIQTTENTKEIAEIKNTMVIKKEMEKITKDMATKKDLLDMMNKLTDISYDKEILILNGEQVEANLAYNKIYSLAKKKIYIIDDYISLKTLVLLKDISKNIKVIIFSDNVNNGLHKIEYEDFVKEYNLNITFRKTNNKYHDRYIIIDYNLENEHIFYSGSSSKDSGKKITSILETRDKTIFKNIINDILQNEELILK